MIGEFRASLYDIFGYLLPGLVGTTAGCLLLWSLAHPGIVLDMGILSHREVVAATLLVAYSVGHLVHAIGNVAPFLRESPEVALLEPATKGRRDVQRWHAPLSVDLIEAADGAVRQMFGIDSASLTPRERVALMDEARIIASREGEREVYVYREGFYRGMSVATGLLSLGLVAAALKGPSCFLWSDALVCPLPLDAWLLAGTAVLGSFGFAARMRRFGRYRVERIVMLWLVIKGKADVEVRGKATGEA